MTDWIEELILSVGYWGFAILTFLESVFPPIPSEIVMPLGGYLSAQQDDLTFVGIVLAGIAGSVLGQLPLFYVGRFFAEERLKTWADRYGHWVLISSSEIERAISWFDRHGGKAVFICRMIPGLRSLISLPAGASHMSLWRFVLLTASGASIWITVLAYAGLVFGERFHDVSWVIQWAAVAIIAAIAASVVVWFVRRRRHQQQKG